MTKEQAREELDKAWYDYFVAIGVNADDVDYSGINELIDDITELMQ